MSGAQVLTPEMADAGLEQNRMWRYENAAKEAQIVEQRLKSMGEEPIPANDRELTLACSRANEGHPDMNKPADRYLDEFPPDARRSMWQEAYDRIQRNMAQERLIRVAEAYERTPSPALNLDWQKETQIIRDRLANGERPREIINKLQGLVTQYKTVQELKDDLGRAQQTMHVNEKH